MAKLAAATEAGPEVKGLVLPASYPTGDLSQSGLAVTSITAAGDKVLNWQKYEAAKAKLPQDAEYLSIPGGSHGQFG